MDQIRISDNDEPTGKAIFQRVGNCQNNCLLIPGANLTHSENQIFEFLESARPDDVFVVQGETNQICFSITQAREKKMKIVFNPAPHPPLNWTQLKTLNIDWLILNQFESESILGESITAAQSDDEVFSLMERICTVSGSTNLILTLGPAGSKILIKDFENQLCYFTSASSFKGACVIDATGAGDTFVGYFVGCFFFDHLWDRDDEPSLISRIEYSIRVATVAAAQCILKVGAACAVPEISQVIHLIDQVDCSTVIRQM